MNNISNSTNSLSTYGYSSPSDVKNKSNSDLISSLSNTAAYSLSLSSNNTNTQNDILTNLNSAYDDAKNYIQSVVDSKNEFNDLLNSYTEAKDEFNDTFSSSIVDLAQASKNMQSTGYQVEGSTDEDTQKNISNVVKNVTNFVNSYNEATTFLNDNSSVSKNVAQLSNSFGDSKYYSNSLATVGISVNSDGTMKVDEAKLSSALETNNDSASYVLNSMTERADKKVTQAARQEDKLFPSVSSMIGSNVEQTQKLYSPQALVTMSNYNSVGNLLSMYA